MHELTRDRVNEDVGAMAITDSQHPSHHRSHGHTPSIVQSHGKPRHRILVLLGEEMPHDRMELLDHLGVFQDQVARVLVLFLDGLECIAELVGPDVAV